MTLQQAFMRNLNCLICEHNTNITRMTKEVGISRTNMYRFMNGQGLPNLHTAWLIAEYFRCGIDDLLEGADMHCPNARGEK